MRGAPSVLPELTVTVIALTCVTAWSAIAAEGPTQTPSDSGVPERAALEGGKAVYERRCAVCHGPQGKGDGPEAPFLSPRPGSLLSAATSVKSDAELLRIIENGKSRTAMPAWKDSLTETERHEVLAYIRSLIRFQRSLTPPPPQ